MRRLVFVGDSITSGWTAPWRGRPVLRSFFPEAAVVAYPGHRPDFMVERMRDGDLARFGGGIAVVMAGVNAMTLRADPADIARDVKQLVALIASRTERVILLSILPAVVWGRNEWPRIRATNELLSHIPGVRWLNVAAAFLDRDRVDARMVTDGVHVTMRGYITLARQLAPVLVAEGAVEATARQASLGPLLAVAGARDALRRAVRRG